MGRNRKFVLEDDLQQAVWRTILRGPRPPSVKWDKPIPATKSGVSKHAQPGSGFPSLQKPEVQSSGEVEDSARHFGRRRRGIDHNQGSAPEGRGSSTKLFIA